MYVFRRKTLNLVLTFKFYLRISNHTVVRDLKGSFVDVVWFWAWEWSPGSHKCKAGTVLWNWMFTPRVRFLPKHHVSSERCAVGLASFSCSSVGIRCCSRPSSRELLSSADRDHWREPKPIKSWGGERRGSGWFKLMKEREHNFKKSI